MKLKLHKTKSNKKIYFPQFETNLSNGLSKSKELDSFYISTFVQHEALETSKPSTQAKANERQLLESKRRSRGMKMIQQSPYQSKARRKIGKKSKVEIRSKRMEAYFLINRNEIEASIVIQTLWRTILARRKLHNIAMQRLAAITIQSFYRSVVARVWVHERIEMLNYYIPKCQAQFRRRLASKKWNKRLECMHSNVLVIQKSIRMFLGKRQAIRQQRHVAALCIQMFYLRFHFESRCEARMRNNKATVIQRIMRRIIAMNFVKKRSIEFNSASLLIQKCWRGRVARVRRNRILINNWDERTNEYILMVEVLIERYEYELTVFEKTMNKHTILENLQEAKAACKDAKVSLHTSLHNSKDLEKMKATMNTKDVAEGWEDEVEESIELERKNQTALKLEIVLKHGFVIQTSKKALREIENLQKEIKAKLEELQSRRAALKSLFDKERRERQKTEEVLQKRKLVGEERRLWNVNHVTVSGKPKKHFKRKQEVQTRDEQILPSFQGGVIDTIAHKNFLLQVEAFKAAYNKVFRL